MSYLKAPKDCDYLSPLNPTVSFVREYRKVGYAAKSIGKGIHGALLHMIDDAEPWIEIGGMLFVWEP